MPADNAEIVYSKTHPFPARITQNYRLNQAGSIKETRHFVVDIRGSGLDYTVGDSLGVFPTNRPAEVAELLAVLGATGDEAVSPAMLKLAEPIALREALSSRLALAGPTSKILKTLREKATDEAEKAKLEGLLDPAHQDDLKPWLEQRHFVDIIREFASAQLTLQELVDHQRKLMPRLYSIASSPQISAHEVHLTVAIVRYETLGQDRVGVCSTYLTDRVQVNETVVPVFVSHSHFGLPEDHADRDIIMVGPGTGIAPFRAFVQERAGLPGKGRNWVFFGDQHEATDFLYGDEWKDHLARGEVDRLDLAWSRDQARKIYVQDKMRDRAAELWQWLEGGAIFYVCGDAKRMAKDVDRALHDIAQEHGGLSDEDTVAFVKQLKKDKRYQRDVY